MDARAARALLVYSGPDGLIADSEARGLRRRGVKLEYSESARIFARGGCQVAATAVVLGHSAAEVRAGPGSARAQPGRAGAADRDRHGRP